MSLQRVIRDAGTLAAVVGQAVLENLWPAQAVRCALDKDYARAVTASAARFDAEERLNKWEAENEVHEPLDEPECEFCGTATSRTVNTDDGPEFVCADCDDPEANEDAPPQTEAQWLGNTDARRQAWLEAVDQAKWEQAPDDSLSGSQTYQTSAVSAAEPPAGVDASPKQSPGGYPNNGRATSVLLTEAAGILAILGSAVQDEWQYTDCGLIAELRDRAAQFKAIEDDDGGVLLW